MANSEIMGNKITKIAIIQFVLTGIAAGIVCYFLTDSLYEGVLMGLGSGITFGAVFLIMGKTGNLGFQK